MGAGVSSPEELLRQHLGGRMPSHRHNAASIAYPTRYCAEVATLVRQGDVAALAAFSIDMTDGCNWQPDATAPACARCGGDFFEQTLCKTGKHHCRVCGLVICGHCIREKVLPHGDGAQRRVKACKPWTWANDVDCETFIHRGVNYRDLYQVEWPVDVWNKRRGDAVFSHLLEYAVACRQEQMVRFLIQQRQRWWPFLSRPRDEVGIDHPMSGPTHEADIPRALLLALALGDADTAELLRTSRACGRLHEQDAPLRDADFLASLPLAALTTVLSETRSEGQGVLLLRMLAAVDGVKADGKDDEPTGAAKKAALVRYFIATRLAVTLGESARLTDYPQDIQLHYLQEECTRGKVRAEVSQYIVETIVEGREKEALLFLSYESPATPCVVAFPVDVRAADVGAAPGATLLHAAAEHGMPGVARELLARGAVVSARDGQGRTPLEAATDLPTTFVLRDWTKRK
eukprot:TRINITY_DN5280_c0_g1_i1.p1 TRINITY_DN5280_c0_g1~~TRINITY_DN5280_c0_g1_i1.p1  ORF type:complete len:460 (+),score=136.76 TRINITY_DN5280_c0_g1_i1:2074-3453(+)